MEVRFNFRDKISDFHSKMNANVFKPTISQSAHGACCRVTSKDSSTPQYFSNMFGAKSELGADPTKGSQHWGMTHYAA